MSSDLDVPCLQFLYEFYMLYLRWYLRYNSQIILHVPNKIHYKKSNIHRDFDPCGSKYIYSVSFKLLCFTRFTLLTSYFFPSYTMPFFGILHKHGTDIMRSDTSCSSKPPYL